MLKTAQRTQSDSISGEFDRAFVNQKTPLIESLKVVRDRSLLGDDSVEFLSLAESRIKSAGRSVSDMDRAILAQQAHNFLTKTKAMSLQETSRDSLTNWVKTGLALITSVYAEDLTEEIISVQPMPTRSAKVHYLDVVAETPKGQISANDALFEALNGYQGSDSFSSEEIVREPVGAAGSSAYNVTLGYVPIMPNSFVITDGTQTAQDDGNGNIIGDVDGNATNTINYITGEITLTFGTTGSPTNTVAPVTCNYTYNIEAALELAEIGINLRSTTVEARSRALSANWSVQALMDFQNEHGIDAESMLMEAASQLIVAERFKHVVNTLRRAQTGGTVVFDNAAPTGVSYLDHVRTFRYSLENAQLSVWQQTQKVIPNKLVISPDVWSIVTSQEGFVPASGIGDTNGLSGPKKVGRLNNQGVDVYADPTYQAGRGLLTYKGGSMLATAAILGMYIPLYQSPQFQRGFRRDAAMLSEYVIHPVDSRQIIELQFLNV